MIPAHLAQVVQAFHPAPLAYGDPTFKAMTDLGHRIVQLGRVRGVLDAIVRHPGVILPVLLAIRRLPMVHITVSSRQAATWFAPHFPPVAGPIFGGRRAQAVLDLGPDDKTYVVGRRKQALRTNLRHANEMGIQAKKIDTYDEWSVAAEEVLRSRGGEPELELIQRMQPPPDRQDVGYYVVTDREDRSVAYSMASIFNDCAVLTCMLSMPHHPAASPSRYLLHTFMRSDLRSRGVHQLVVGSAITVSPGLQYFQHLLGYEVRNLHITVQDGAELVPTPSLATL